MTQTPEDEWFAPDNADSATDIQRQPAEDDWLITGDRAPRARALDLSAVNSPHGLAAMGVVVLSVVALIAVVVALTDSAPSAVQLIPIASLPAATPHVPKTSTSVSPVRSLSVPTTTLKPGDTGPQVKTLQRELRALGYLVGGIDGSYGTQTSKAVSAFQRARHLTVDGIVGPKTLLALSP
jgi:putative peptidoglycan binding protein